MAAQSGLTERTFKRRFKQATGYTPVDYVHTLRVEEAKQIHEATQDSIESISESVGYEDPGFFRRLFKRVAGIAPGEYRRQFQTSMRYGIEAVGDRMVTDADVSANA